MSEIAAAEIARVRVLVAKLEARRVDLEAVVLAAKTLLEGDEHDREDAWILLDDAHRVRWVGDECIDNMTTLMDKQKADIERLRDELDTWRSVFPDIAPQRVLPDRRLLHSEIERLRAALRYIERIDAYPHRCREIARAALKEGAGDE